MTLELTSSWSENLQASSPDVVVLPSAAEVDKYAFDKVFRVITQKPDAVLTLATGSSPLGLYELMIDAYRQNRLDMSGLTTRKLDEYWPLPKDHPQSYSRFMRDNLFNHVNIPEDHRFIPDSTADDPEKEMQRYRSILEKTGPADLAILGIGPELTCHIAFNERGSTPNSRARLVQIDPITIKANARFFDGDETRVPCLAMTQGIADILESKEIILIAKGIGKAQGIARALEGQIGPDAPASYLRLHPKVTFIIDREAGSILENGFYHQSRKTLALASG